MRERANSATAPPFAVMDCTLLLRMSGLPPAYNMRDLSDRIASCSDDTLYHHFCETLLRPTFDDPDYRNDFAVWAKQGLGDPVLAEQLGIIDPYSFASLTELRAHVHEIIEERLAEVSPWAPTARPGYEFRFTEATIVVFDTGERVRRPHDLPRSIARMSDGSIYFHFLEARRRPPRQMDDFSAWLREYPGDWARHLQAIQGIDVHFHSLPTMRRALADSLLGLPDT
ncbi:MAG: DUF5752 family protein [Candidatus Zixiibacteriota bacterium]